jgi:hypothetical protein
MKIKNIIDKKYEELTKEEKKDFIKWIFSTGRYYTNDFNELVTEVWESQDSSYEDVVEVNDVWNWEKEEWFNQK